MGVEALRRAAGDRRPLSPEQVDLEAVDDGEGDLFLDREDVLEAPVESLRPHV